MFKMQLGPGGADLWIRHQVFTFIQIHVPKALVYQCLEFLCNFKLSC